MHNGDATCARTDIGTVLALHDSHAIDARADVGAVLALHDADATRAGADIGAILALHDADATGARADVGAALALHCGGTVGAGGEVDGRLLLNDGHAVAIGRIGPGWALRYMDLAGTITGSVCLADSGYADLVRENPPGAGCALVGMGVHLCGSLYLDVRALVQHQAAIASADGAGVLLAGHPHGTLFAAVEDDASFRAA